MRGFALLIVMLAPPAIATAPAQIVVGLVPAEDPAVTAALADGARLAFEESAAAGGARPSLVIGAGPPRWSSVASTAVELACARGAAVLIAPPERMAAHAVAQVGTRAQVPVLAIHATPSVTATGSTWVRAVAATTAFDPRAPEAVPFRNAFRQRYGRDPGVWEAAGYDAGRMAVALVAAAAADPGLDWKHGPGRASEHPDVDPPSRRGGVDQRRGAASRLPQSRG